MNWRTLGSSLQGVGSLELVTVGNTVVTVASVLTFLLLLLISFWVSRALQRVVRRALSRSGITEGNISAVARLLHYAVLAVGTAVALQTIGISLSTLFAAGAVVAVAVGFATQNILQNFMSGLILLTERSITESDVLELDGTLIRIERMGIRSTVARTRDDEQLIVPNSSLVQSTVKNLTLADQAYRVRATVGVSYRSDMRQVEETLVASARAVASRLPDRDPVPLLLEFGDSAVVWEVSVWTDDPWHLRSTRSALNKAIWWGLKEAGITIAFPQMDVHFDPGAGTPN